MECMIKVGFPRKVSRGESFFYLGPEGQTPWNLVLVGERRRDEEGFLQTELEVLEEFPSREELLLRADSLGLKPEFLDFDPDFWELVYHQRIVPLLAWGPHPGMKGGSRG